MQDNPIVIGRRKLIVPSGESSIRPFEAPSQKELRPPEFPRSPRNFVPYPDEEVSIQLPPPAPMQPTMSLFTLLMPLLGVLLMVGFSAFAASQNSQNGKIPLYAFVSLPMAAVSVGAGVYNYYRNKNIHKAAVENRISRYKEYLKNKKAELTNLSRLQREASFSAHPDLNLCLQYAKDLTPTRLWERENGDPDFLDVRLGIGDWPSTFSIKVPTQSQFQLVSDPLDEEARNLPEAFGRVANVAVALPLAQVGAAGFIGNRDAIIREVRACLLHLAAHHSPSEVKIVVLTSEKESTEWDWVRWLPHNWSDGREVRFFANGKSAHSSVLNYVETILKQRQNQQSVKGDSLPVPVFVVVWADSSLWRGPEAIKFGPLLDLVLKNGKELGAVSLFLSEHIARVPKASEAIVDMGSNPAALRILGTKPQKVNFNPDYADRKAAWQFANNLSSVRLAETGGGAANLPATTTLVELIGAGKLEDLDVLSLWKASEPYKTLAVPIGIGAGGKHLFLNLHEKGHGPHGLVAGTTGSGKTALLSTYLALAALYYHPHELGFIGIDFKGGDLIRDLKDLPHMIGTMTNLEGQGTGWAIKILRGEIKKRQTRFNRAGIGNIYEYQKMHRGGALGAEDPMPHIVIICDEFAELKKEQPQFISELVSISRVGRSLGIHLILATQKPAGVVSEEIWSNSHFHLCLKVASVEDSREMLRRPEAADIRQQGRAYFQVGMNEVFELFQAAWGDAPYAVPDTLSNQPPVKQVLSDGTRVPLWPPRVTTGSGKTQIQELVHRILDVCANNHIERLEGIWPITLADRAGVTLQELLEDKKLEDWLPTEWQKPPKKLSPIIGVKDDPENQRQDLLQVDLENDGHFVLFGAPGTGKTTVLHTLIVSTMVEHSPALVHFYMLDCSGRSLSIFENLPHVGAVVTLGENERIRRLMSFLLEELERRKKLFEHDQNLVNYRKNHPDKPEADIILVLDGYSHFAEAYKLQTIQTELDALVKLASQGGNLGIHLVITTDQLKSFPAKLAGNFRVIATLELNDANDYIQAVGRTGGLYPPKDMPGRGLIKDQSVLEFQSARPGANAAEIKALLDRMIAGWQEKIATQVRILPDVLTLDEILPAGSGVVDHPAAGFPVPLGFSMAKANLPLLEVPLSSGPHFWISGSPQSGKTSFLQTWLLSLAERYSPAQLRFCLFDFGWGNFEILGSLPHVLFCSTDSTDLRAKRFDDLLSSYINVDMTVAKPVALNNPNRPTVLMAVDGFGPFTKGIASDTQDKDKIGDKNRDYLKTLMNVKNSRFHFIATGYPADFSGTASLNPLGDQLRAYQAGFWLGDVASDTGLTFGIQFMTNEVKTGLPKGHTFYYNRGKYSLLKAATCHLATPELGEWIESIRQREQPPSAPLKGGEKKLSGQARSRKKTEQTEQIANN